MRTVKGFDRAMAHLSALEIDNWIAIYGAAGICCAFALVLSVATTAVEVHRERAWEDFKSVRGAILFIPRTWWRWQKLYLLSTPMMLAIVASFAATLSWG
jgi:hypothetical protein